MPPIQRARRKISVVNAQQRNYRQRMRQFISAFILGMFLLLVMAVGFWMWYQRFAQEDGFPLKRVVLLRPLIYADENSITQAVESFGKRDLLQIEVSQLAEELRKIDWVKSASVTKQWPDALRIDVQERVPILRWGERQFLDADAMIFSLPESPALAQLFPVQGARGTEMQILSMYRHLNPWLNQQGLSLRGLQLDTRQVWHLYLSDGIEVILGREELSKRLKKLVVIKEKMMQRYGQYIATIDLRYSDGFSVRWKAGVSPVKDKDQKQKAGK